MRCLERFQNMEEILIWNKTGEEIEIDKENYRKDKNVIIRSKRKINT